MKYNRKDMKMISAILKRKASNNEGAKEKADKVERTTEH
jgi:hypothetical protein